MADPITVEPGTGAWMLAMLYRGEKLHMRSWNNPTAYIWLDGDEIRDQDNEFVRLEAEEIGATDWEVYTPAPEPKTFEDVVMEMPVLNWEFIYGRDKPTAYISARAQGEEIARFRVTGNTVERIDDHG